LGIQWDNSKSAFVNLSPYNDDPKILAAHMKNLDAMLLKMLDTGELLEEDLDISCLPTFEGLVYPEERGFSDKRAEVNQKAKEALAEVLALVSQVQPITFQNRIKIQEGIPDATRRNKKQEKLAGLLSELKKHLEEPSIASLNSDTKKVLSAIFFVKHLAAQRLAQETTVNEKDIKALQQAIDELTQLEAILKQPKYKINELPTLLSHIGQLGRAILSLTGKTAPTQDKIDAVQIKIKLLKERRLVNLREFALSNFDEKMQIILTKILSNQQKKALVKILNQK
jgi:hypothetical protein